MQYMLLLTETENEVALLSDPAKAGPYWGAWGAYVQAIEAAGIVVNGAGLQPPRTVE